MKRLSSIILLAMVMFMACTEICPVADTNENYKSGTLTKVNNGAASSRFEGTYWADRDSLMNEMVLSEDGDEKLRLCQIDENDLVAMSTKDLVKACFDFPLAFDIFLNNDEMYATRFYVEHFNGLSELLSREDAIHEMILFYASLDSGEDASSMREAYYDRVLTCKSFRDKMTEVERNELLRIVSSRYERICDSRSNVVSTARKKDLETSLRDGLEPYLGELSGFTQPSYSQTTTHTPFGKTVTCYIANNDYTSAEKDSIALHITMTYSNITILDPATYSYNCHVYAWLNSSSLWMYGTQLQYFYTDDLYTSCPEEAYSIVYYNGDHSALHYNGTSLSYYTSKWGSGPLIKHAPTNVPASYQPSNRSYYKKIPFSITGPDMYVVGTEYTYTVTPYLSYATYDWSIEQNSNTYQIVSINDNVLKIKFLNNTLFYHIYCNVADETGNWIVNFLDYETVYTP